MEEWQRQRRHENFSAYHKYLYSAVVGTDRMAQFGQKLTDLQTQHRKERSRELEEGNIIEWE